MEAKRSAAFEIDRQIAIGVHRHGVRIGHTAERIAGAGRCRVAPGQRQDRRDPDAAAPSPRLASCRRVHEHRIGRRLGRAKRVSSGIWNATTSAAKKMEAEAVRKSRDRRVVKIPGPDYGSMIDGSIERALPDSVAGSPERSNQRCRGTAWHTSCSRSLWLIPTAHSLNPPATRPPPADGIAHRRSRIGNGARAQTQVATTSWHDALQDMVEDLKGYVESPRSSRFGGVIAQVPGRKRYFVVAEIRWRIEPVHRRDPERHRRRPAADGPR